MEPMTGKEKIGVYLLGVLLGLVILSLIPRNGEEGEEHPWHEQTAPEGYYPQSWEDDFGREITLKKQPRYFISLAPNLTEILYAMDMGDHLMAVTRWAEHPEAARALRDEGGNVGDMDKPNRELIASYKPDLIVGSEHTPLDIYEMLHRPPETVAVAFKQSSIDDILDDTRRLGILIGTPGKALKLVEEMTSEKREVERRLEPVKDSPRKRVLYMLGIEEDLMPGWTPGSDSWFGDIIKRCHAENLASQIGSSWGRLSQESLLELDPEVLIIRRGESEEENAILEERVAAMSSHPVWSQLEAVKRDQVKFIPYEPFNIPGPRVIRAYEIMAETIWESTLE